MDRIRSLLRLAGKGDRKVMAVFAASAAGAGRAISYLRDQAPDMPLFLFCVERPASEIAGMCEDVVVKRNPLALLFAAQKRLWPFRVALSTATWTGEHFRWPLKAAPFLVPPCRALILNRNGDFVPGTPAHLALHFRRLVRDAIHSGWSRIKDVTRGWALWWFALVAQHFAPLSRALFRGRHGSKPLDLPAPAPSGEGIAVFRHPHRRWNYAELIELVRNSTARYILFLERGAQWDPGGLLRLFDDPLTFAVSRQPAYRAWRECCFPIAPFRRLQPDEVAETMGPVSDAMLVDRAKLAALGAPKTIVPGSAWMLLFWQAAAAGWRSYSAGSDRAIGECPETPYEDAEFVTRVLAEPELQALGPRDPVAGRGAVAVSIVRGPRPTGDDLRHVLVVSPYLPWPLSHGGAVRIWNLCRALSPRVRFTLACFREAQDVVDYAKLSEVFAEIYIVDRDQRAASDPALPAQVREHQSDAMRHLIGRITLEQHIDALQIEFTHLAHFREAAPQIPGILVEHDLTFALYRQYAAETVDRRARQEYERWLQYESGWLARYDTVWTMSDDDRAEATAAGAAAERTVVVPNGVDIARFTPGSQPTDAPEVLFIGGFRHRPNVIAFERLLTEIMPEVWKRIPQARLCVIAGLNPGRYWKAPRTLDSRVVLHEFIEDVRPYYARAAAVAVPLVVSAGTNIKVLEAMACGKAVVSTSVGCRGLGLADGREILIRETPADFAAAMCETIASTDLAEALGRAARAAAVTRFSWEAIAQSALSSYEPRGLGARA